jgi:flagellar basal-body rod protein FlgB
MAAKRIAIRAYVLAGAAHNGFTSPHGSPPAGAQLELATMLNRLNDALDFHAQALSLRSERQRLIASNIANADTPGYVARDFNFAQTLREAAGVLQPARALTASQPGHVSGHGSHGGDSRRAPPNLLYATPSQTNLDRNTVDMDRERANFTDNSVKYEATLRFINAHVRTTLSAITGQ